MNADKESEKDKLERLIFKGVELEKIGKLRKEDFKKGVFFKKIKIDNRDAILTLLFTLYCISLGLIIEPKTIIFGFALNVICVVLTFIISLITVKNEKDSKNK